MSGLDSSLLCFVFSKPPPQIPVSNCLWQFLCIANTLRGYLLPVLIPVSTPSIYLVCDTDFSYYPISEVLSNLNPIIVNSKDSQQWIAFLHFERLKYKHHRFNAMFLFMVIKCWLHSWYWKDELFPLVQVQGPCVSPKRYRDLWSPAVNFSLCSMLEMPWSKLPADWQASAFSAMVPNCQGTPAHTQCFDSICPVQ